MSDDHPRAQSLKVVEPGITVKSLKPTAHIYHLTASLKLIPPILEFSQGLYHVMINSLKCINMHQPWEYQGLPLNEDKLSPIRVIPP